LFTIPAWVKRLKVCAGEQPTLLALLEKMS
jgi:hypothetical protein